MEIEQPNILTLISDLSADLFTPLLPSSATRSVVLFVSESELIFQ